MVTFVWETASSRCFAPTNPKEENPFERSVSIVKRKEQRSLFLSVRRAMASGNRVSAIPLSSCLLFLVFSLVTGVSSSGFISDGIFEEHHTVGRGLLQVEKNCPVDFEFKNYTIITSQCKGPRYLPDPCCNALKQFACPYAQQLNDLTNNCATTMFNYINLAGNYPPGLFANECRGDKKGLVCNGTYELNEQASPSSSTMRFVYSYSLLALTVGILCFLL